MFYQVNTGATGANALTGIRAANSALIKRPDPTADTKTVSDNGSVKWQPSSAGIAAARRPAQAIQAAQAVIDAATAADATPATTAAATQPAAVLDTVEISDEGRELSEQMSESNPVYTISGFRFVPDGDNSFKIVPDEAKVFTISADSKPRIIREGDETILMLPENFIESHREAKAQRLANPPVDELGELMREAMAYNVDNTLLFSLYSNTEMDNTTAFKLASELGRLLSDPRETLETRVANREKGLKLAEYIAENYIDDPAAKQTFLDRAKEVANLYEMRDKGYNIYWTMDEKLHIDKPDDNLLVIAGKPTVKAATDIIDRVKNSLNMNTVKEDALNILKKIIATAGSHYLYNPDGTFINTEEFRKAMLSKLE
ncbi:MAG: hypothetical protein LBC59_03595 [Chitinispirillales bacterium]|jgi:hypothetical protein|nr:hypothetical protein [Chitinispirillales bacterium]